MMMYVEYRSAVRPAAYASKAALFLMLILALVTGSSFAKTETRKMVINWCLHDCTIAGEYPTRESVLAAFNAVVDQTFSDKVAQMIASNESCTYTLKNNRYDPVAIGGTIVYNSQSERYVTTNNVITYFYAKCNSNAAHTTTAQNSSAAMELSMRRHCPREGGWENGADTHTYVSVGGVTTDSWHVYCYREIPDPQSCVAGGAPPKPLFGNPINAIDATKNESERDYASADGRLLVQRSYTSAGGGRWTWAGIGAGLIDYTGRTSTNPDAIAPMSGTYTAIPEGIYLNTSLPAESAKTASFPLLITQPDTGQKEVAILLNGSRIVFVENPTGVFRTKTPGSRSLEVSTSSGVQWFLRSNEEFSLFDGVGTLTQRVRRDGDTVTYVQVGNVVTATSNVSGRTISYTKHPITGAVLSVTLPNGTTLNYSQGSNGEASSVTYPDGSVKTYFYDEGAYSGSTIPAPKLLTGVVDENLSRLSTFIYDGVNAVSTERSGGVEKFSIVPTFGASYVTVSKPVGSASTLYWELGPDGERRMVRNSQPAGSGCAAASSFLTYDANGNKASEDDFDGHRVCYVSDLTRNLETGRVEGLSNTATCSTYTAANAVLPVGSRKVSTVWHPDWRLETKVSEPGRLTTSVYNGQPDPFNGNAIASCAPSTALLPDGKPIAVLCKQVQQATTDVDGHLGFTAALQSGVVNRVSQWTYNQYGQVLTAKDPLNNTTTYAYYTDTSFTGTDPNAVGHTIGDLQTVTNAKGQVSTYSQYNKHGQLMQSSDPNGVLTANTYDLRQRLLSTSVGGQTTSYSYDPAGQLLKVTAPDTSWVGYEYDPAHRMTATKDNLGNRIEYTLDNAGNRTAENVKDPGGVLARTLARSIDALGRVQQTTGRE